MNAPNADRGSMSDLDRTMERVRKLLAIAEDERADANEAAAAAAMADKIMRKFQIEHADVVARSMSRADSFDSQDVSALMKRAAGANPDWYRPTKVPMWAQWLATKIATLHDCQARLAETKELGACLRFSGYKADTQVAAWTFDYLSNAMISSTRRWQKDAKTTLGRARGKDESESYRRGFIMSLNASIVKLIAEKTKEMQQASSSRALVLVKAQAVAERFGVVKYGTSRSRTSDGDAFSAGREAGKAVNVGVRVVGGSSSAALRIAK